MSGSVMLVVGVVVFIVLLLLWYPAQIRKNYLNEWESDLGIKSFKVGAGLGSCSMKGIWKDVPIAVRLAAPMFGKAAPMVIRMGHKADFSADIRPGPGFDDERKAQQKAQKEAEDSAVARPWRAKLTAEEQEILDKRHGVSAADKGSREKFKVESNRPDHANAYLAAAGRREALEDLFRSGYSLVDVEMDEIIFTKDNYAVEDLKSKLIERELKKLRDLRVG